MCVLQGGGERGGKKSERVKGVEGTSPSTHSGTHTHTHTDGETGGRDRDMQGGAPRGKRPLTL